MKLEQKLPDREGTWWCYREPYEGEEREPEARYVYKNDAGEFVYYIPRGPGLEGALPGRYTHFAGPIEWPDSPEQDKVEVAARIIQNDNCETHKVVLDAIAVVPVSFVGVELKVTIEKA